MIPARVDGCHLTAEGPVDIGDGTPRAHVHGAFVRMCPLQHQTLELGEEPVVIAHPYDVVACEQPAENLVEVVEAAGEGAHSGIGSH